MAIIENVGGAEVRAIRRVKCNRAVARCDHDGLLHGSDRPACRLHDDACIQQNIAEVARGTVQAGRFEAIEFENAVVDSQPREGRENVFGKGDPGGRGAERGAAIRVGHFGNAGDDGG